MTDRTWISVPVASRRYKIYMSTLKYAIDRGAIPVKVVTVTYMRKRVRGSDVRKFVANMKEWQRERGRKGMAAYKARRALLVVSPITHRHKIPKRQPGKWYTQRRAK